jgi:hypothetical protein
MKIITNLKKMQHNIRDFTFLINPHFTGDMMLENGKKRGVGLMPDFVFKEEDYNFAKKLLNMPISEILAKSSEKRPNSNAEYKKIAKEFKKFNININDSIIDLKDNIKAFKAMRMLIRFNFLGNEGIGGMENWISSIHRKYDEELKNDTTKQKQMKDIWGQQYGDCRHTNTWVAFLTSIYIDEKHLSKKYEVRVGNFELYLDEVVKEKAKINALNKSDIKKPIDRAKEQGYNTDHCIPFLIDITQNIVFTHDGFYNEAINLKNTKIHNSNSEILVYRNPRLSDDLYKPDRGEQLKISLSPIALSRQPVIIPTSYADTQQLVPYKQASR